MVSSVILHHSHHHAQHTPGDSAHSDAVILSPAYYAQWLSPTEQDPASLAPLLKPYPADDMEGYVVSTLVNDPKNDRRVHRAGVGMPARIATLVDTRTRYTGMHSISTVIYWLHTSPRATLRALPDLVYHSV